MSDDAPGAPDPMDVIEMFNAGKGMAVMLRGFYEGLIEQEFDNADAMRLTVAYVVGMAGGKAS